MLNVSCQKQKHCSSFPTDKDSLMEFVGEPRPSGACGLLGVPVQSTLDLDLDLDDDEGEVVIGIRPKSSPLPRRKSSASEEDSEPGPPLCGSRRVSFADAKGLSLVQVKEFDTWDVPNLPGYDTPESKGKDAEEYFLSPLTFSVPLSTEELLNKVHEQKVELETIELIPGTTILKGVIRVLNVSFLKAVYVRTTLDSWSSHFDLLAEYVPGSSESLTDCFSFKLTLVPPFGEQGARVDFCVRYETPVGTFWANNNNRNYVMFCHQRVKRSKEKPRRENFNKKSCLKTIGHNLSSVEITSAVENPSSENISKDVSKHEEKLDTIIPKQMSDDKSGTSDESEKKLLAESQWNNSQRNRRKAAQMARLKDYFAQRAGAENETEGDESPPQAKEPVQEPPTEEKHSDVQSYPEQCNKSEDPPFVAGSLVTCNLPILDAAHDKSAAHDYMSSSEPEKSESSSSVSMSTLTGGESAADIRNNPSRPHNAHVPAECQAINLSASIPEDSSQDMSHECISNTAAEPVDAVVSAGSSESLVSTSSSFTFGTAVAPLYQQLFGREGSESQSVDGGNPVPTTLNARGSTQSHPHSDERETGGTVPTDARGNKDRVHGSVIKTEDLKQGRLQATVKSPHTEEKEISFSVTENHILGHADILSVQSSTNISVALEDAVAHPHTVNTLDADSSNPKIPAETLHPRGEAQEDDVTHDLQSRTTAKTADPQPPQDARAQIQTYPRETHAQSEKEARSSLETSSLSCQPSQRVTECVSDEADQQNSNKSVPHISQNETHYVDAENTEAMISNNIHGDTSVKLKDEDTLACEELTVSEEIQHHEIETVVSKEEDFCPSDTTEVKNWERMVEEEETNLLTDGEESQAVGLEDIEIREEDDGEQLNDAGQETASENKNTRDMEKEKTAAKTVRAITAARLKENKTEDADLSQGEHRKGEGGNWEIMIIKDDVEKKLMALETAEKAAEGKIAEESDTEKKDDQEEIEKDFAEMHKISIGGTNVQEEEEEIMGEEEMEIDLQNGDEASVECKDQVKMRKENVEEEIPDYKDDILAYEKSSIVDLESERMTTGDKVNEAGCSEERLDTTESNPENDLSAPADDVHDSGVSRTENTAQEQNALMKIQTHLHNNVNGTHDPSQAVRDETKRSAAEGGPGALEDEPESEQLSQDSRSSGSDSDDEVELYMHCLRAVHAGPQAHKDRDRDAGSGLGKSVGRSKPLSTPMPSISESMDEEQPLSCLQESHKETETADIQTIAAALPASSGQGSISRKVSWWMDSFYCGKTLLYATLLVLFAIVAYNYDFLACFGLYVISVIWLCCQGEKPPVKNNRTG